MDWPVVRTVWVRFSDGRRADADVQDVIEAANRSFPGFPGVIGFRAGRCLDGEQDMILVVGFERFDDVDSYRVSPGHVAFLETWLKPRGAVVQARTFAMA